MFIFGIVKKRNEDGKNEIPASRTIADAEEEEREKNEMKADRRKIM